MFDTPNNRENTMMTVSALERMTDLYRHKPARSSTVLQRARRLLRSKGVAGAARWAKRKLKAARRGRKASAPANPVPGNSLHLDSCDTAAREELYFSKEKIAVYTALFGAYDKVQSPLIRPDNIEYFIITDQNTGTGSWTRLDVDGMIPEEILGDPILCNRWCKMHPHLLFPEYRTSVYVDANLLITSDLTPLTAALESFPVSMFMHGRRSCVYDEIKVCEGYQLICKEEARAQEALLRRHGVPEHWGLLEAPVIARRHQDERCVKLMEEWWNTFYTEPARRDQIALIDCLWRMNIPPEQIGTLGADIFQCPMLLRFPHVQQR